jgi:hypothetical protein
MAFYVAENGIIYHKKFIISYKTAMKDMILTDRASFTFDILTDILYLNLIRVHTLINDYLHQLHHIKSKNFLHTHFNAKRQIAFKV